MATDLTIVIDDPTQLDLLATQSIQNAVVVALGDAASNGATALLTRSKGWSYREAGSLQEAVSLATTAFIVEWGGVQWADANVLEDLLAQAIRHPELAGALSANFDPMILWRTAAFDDSQQFEFGLAQGTARALGGLNRLSPNSPDIGSEQTDSD